MKTDSVTICVFLQKIIRTFPHSTEVKTMQWLIWWVQSHKNASRIFFCLQGDALYKVHEHRGNTFGNKVPQRKRENYIHSLPVGPWRFPKDTYDSHISQELYDSPLKLRVPLTPPLERKRNQITKTLCIIFCSFWCLDNKIAPKRKNRKLLAKCVPTQEVLEFYA